jgi:hypothetical protein
MFHPHLASKFSTLAVTSVADLGSGAFLTLRSGMEKNAETGPRCKLFNFYSTCGTEINFYPVDKD